MNVARLSLRRVTSTVLLLELEVRVRKAGMTEAAGQAGRDDARV